jgi:hypothetical protein
MCLVDGTVGMRPGTKPAVVTADLVLVCPLGISWARQLSAVCSALHGSMHGNNLIMDGTPSAYKHQSRYWSLKAIAYNLKLLLSLDSAPVLHLSYFPQVFEVTRHARVSSCDAIYFEFLLLQPELEPTHARHRPLFHVHLSRSSCESPRRVAVLLTCIGNL